MAKIMLVEDDNNLREIYEARLLAEGYEIVSAEDGEQALALAVKEKPDLIISDVMMPKISGFDMLDILRSTPETRNTKVIMMTALSQAEDKARASKLGADRYLVKSQVTLEDVAKVAREVLQDEDTVPAAAAATPKPADEAPTPGSTAVPGAPIEPLAPASEPPAAAAQPATSDEPAIPVATPPAEPPADTAAPATPTDPTAGDQGGSPSVVPKVSPSPPVAGAQAASAEAADIEKQIASFVQQMPSGETPAPAPAQPAAPQPSLTATPTPLPVAEPPKDEADATNTAASTAAQMANAVNDLLEKAPVAATPSVPPEPHPGNQIAGKKVIKPINDLSDTAPNINDLLAKEMADTAPVAAAPAPPTTSTPTPPAPQAAAPAAPTAQTNEQPVDIKTPGNVVQPGNDPNSIAL